MLRYQRAVIVTHRNEGVEFQRAVMSKEIPTSVVQQLLAFGE